MNPDQPSREQIEARLTALLLGELPAEEAELLRWTISQDPELQKLQGRLLLTVGLVREVVGHPEEASAGEGRSAQPFRRTPPEAARAFQNPAPNAETNLFWLKRIEVRPLVTGAGACGHCRRSSGVAAAGVGQRQTQSAECDDVV